MKLAFCDCFSGISGDMFLAAMIDAGLSPQLLNESLTQLKLEEHVEVQVEEVHKGALRATQITVLAPHSHHHRHLSDIQSIIGDSPLPDPVKTNALKTFQVVAEAEARVHGSPIDHVHFHEVGALDSIADVVGAAVGMHELGIERLYASALPYGSGQVNSDHGPLPLPAPATLEILARGHAPLVASPAQSELVTPTGAAILAAHATFERPDMVLTRVGVGAGRKDLPWPNVLRLMLGESPAAVNQPVVLMETNIDDMNPEFFGSVMARLFAAGALDVFMTPIYMKKNRPATLLGVVARRSDEAELAKIILSETSTLGLRVQPVYRYEAQRELRSVQTPYGKLNVKVKLLDGRAVQAQPEYEECQAAAQAHNVPVGEVYLAALLAGKDVL